MHVVTKIRFDDIFQRERDGFHRVASLSRPATAAVLRGQESPMFDKSNRIFGESPNNQLELSPARSSFSRPTTPQFPSISPFSPAKDSSDRPCTSPGLGAFHLGGRTLENTNKFSPSHRPQTASPVPRFVSTDKMVCRFHAFLETKRPWEENGPLGTGHIESYIIRYMTILYYIYDDSIEINEVKEVNSGLMQGVFLKRIKAKKEDGTPFSLVDFQIGNNVKIFGHSFHITDADSFTRDYFRKELNINLPQESRPVTASHRSLNRSFVVGHDTTEKTHVLGSQFATGLGPIEPTVFDKDRSYRSCSTAYKAVKKELQKANRFFKNEGKRLQFICVEVGSPEPPFFPNVEGQYAQLEAKRLLSNKDRERYGYYGFVASDSVRKFALNFYMETNYADLGVLDKEVNGQDEPNLLVKRGPLPRDWRNPDRGNCEVNDFRVGEVMDIFGRYFLLVDCDDYTRMYCEEEVFLKQVPVLLLKEEIIPIIHPIPAKGQGSLPIGSFEDSLSNVYGMPRVQKDMVKARRNQGKTLRAKAMLLEGSIVDMSRSFLVTFFLEDDTLQIYEENQRNSGVVGGSFLKRGKYMNDGATMKHRQEVEEELQRSPPRHGVPTTEQQLALIQPIYISSHELYLGSILTVNNFVLKIVEMDNMSLKFCESYPEEFPFSDVNRLMRDILKRLQTLRLDVRLLFRTLDVHETGYVSQEAFVLTLDSLNVVSTLNDQELLTLIRRFQDKASVLHQSRLPSSSSLPVRRGTHRGGGGIGGGRSIENNSAVNHDLPMLLTALAAEGFGEARDESIFSYDDFCDYLVYIDQMGEENVAINVMPATAQDAWAQFLRWCQTKSTPWRHLLRKEAMANADMIGLTGKLPLPAVQNVFFKHGMPSSLLNAVMPILQQNYALSAEETRAIWEQNRKRQATSSRPGSSLGHLRNGSSNSSSRASPAALLSLPTSPTSSLPSSPMRSPSNNAKFVSLSALQQQQQQSPTFASSTAGRIANLRRMRDKLTSSHPSSAASSSSSSQGPSRTTTPAPASQSLDEAESTSTTVVKQTERMIIDIQRLCDDVFVPRWV